MSPENENSAIAHSTDDVETLPPDELDEATLRILDIRTRLRQRRRRMIRTFSLVFLIVGLSLFLGLYFSGGQEGKENAQEQKQIEQEIAENGGAVQGITDILPPPPSDIATTCHMDNLGDFIGIAHCEAACEVSDCCEVPIGFALSCLKGNEQVCQDYAQHCDILHSLPSAGFIPQVNEPTLPPEQLKIEIDSKCIGLDREFMYNSPCMDLCQSGFCCFEQSSSIDDGGEDCDANCQAYLNCGVAYEESIAGAPVAAPTFADSIVDACAGFPDDNVRDCEDICAPSICCFNHYCTPPSQVDCKDYAACFVLHEQDNGAPYNEDLADDIHEACFTTNIIEATSNTECTSLCEAGSCCFDNQSCDESIVNCATYAECNVLHPKYVVVAADEVQQACESSSYADLCEQICHLKVMQCCFHHDDNVDACANDPLLHPGSVFCNIYNACQELGTSADDLLSSHQDELSRVCGDSTTRSECIQLCSAATCCFAQKPQDACENAGKTIDCSHYQPCDVLYQ